MQSLCSESVHSGRGGRTTERIPHRVRPLRPLALGRFPGQQIGRIRQGREATSSGASPGDAHAALGLACSIHNDATCCQGRG